LYAPVRQNEIYSPVPLKFNIEWEINVPKGYKPNDQLKDETITSNINAKTDIKYNYSNDKVIIKASVNMPEMYLKAGQYSDLITFLSNSLKAVDKNIVFKKN